MSRIEMTFTARLLVTGTYGTPLADHEAEHVAHTCHPAPPSDVS